jgi:peroxiredoxin
VADVETPGAREAEASPAQSAVKHSIRLRLGRRTVVIAAAVAVVLLGGALAATLATSGSSGGSGRVVNGNTIEYTAGHRPLAPDFAGTSLTGTPVSMSSYQGKVLVLNFWGAWCAPCRSEAETLEVAYQQYHGQGVDFLGDDVADTPANALSFIHSENISYPSINDPGYAVVQRFSAAAPVSDTPTTVVIDKTGHVVGMVLGTISTGDLTTLLHDAGVTT